ncbi:MAG: YlmH/Sll1252 family protein [Oscillospiraceae bacterium]|nr:YlmH/Sll1252 family protein [Oscillospiraceae bacterium]
MDKATLIARFAETDEDKIILARAMDRIAAGYDRNIPTATAFLTARERILTGNLLRAAGLPAGQFFGGFDAAERTVCAYLPDYLEPESYFSGENSPVALVRATFHAGDGLTHRDFLGSLMGAGIKRETVGDIFVDSGSCDFFALREILPYILQNLSTAGRSKLSLAEIPVGLLRRPEEKIREIRDTVSSLRMDAVVASGFHLSRGKAAALIEGGKATLNHMPTIKSDKQVSMGDTITVRSLGKLELTTVGGETKKGRIGITISRYL